MNECVGCKLLGKCTRHPSSKKTPTMMSICNGEFNPQTRDRWLRLWDSQNGGSPHVPVKRDLSVPRQMGAQCCGSGGIASRAVDVTKAAAAWIMGGAQVPPVEVLEGRREVCRSCEFFLDNWCQKCSCYLPAKTSMATSFCPINKWSTWSPELYANSAFVPTKEQIPNQRRRRLVITIGVGDEFESMLELTAPFMRAFAERCDADFVSLTQLTQHWPLYEKFRIRQWAAAYDQTLFIDGDCLVKPKAPNLFEVVPAGAVGIHDDRYLNRDNGWVLRAWDRIIKSQNLFREIATPSSVFNSGVVMVDRSTSFIWERPEFPLPGEHEDEQVWIQSTIEDRGVPVFRLDRSWNEQWYTQHTEPGNSPARWELLASDANIIHFARCPDRLAQIKRWISKI